MIDCIRKTHVGMLRSGFALLMLCTTVFGSVEGTREATAERQPRLKESWAELFKPKPGTQYVDGMPKEIIWLKDGAEMVLVPGGGFLFGEEKEKREEPTFYIDKYPVTNERYKKFVDATGYVVPYMDTEWAKPYNWGKKTYPKGKAKHPVVLVSWHNAAAYCLWAGKSSPSETQWEKAARGTDGRDYPWGNEFKDGRCNSYHEGLEKTTPVDKYPQGVSPYGCYDMAGNVWEWTSTPRKLGWVLKGGSWFDGDVRVRCSTYGWTLPEVRAANTGFRCAVVLPE
jgi:formylglycine-generating enzyme required for sulfatase activity